MAESVSIKDSIIIWALLLIGIFTLGFMSGLRILSALAFASLIALIALTTFYPVTNFSSLTTGNQEVQIYFVILVLTTAYLILYLCNKILSDKRYYYHWSY